MAQTLGQPGAAREDRKLVREFKVKMKAMMMKKKSIGNVMERLAMLIE